MCLCWAMQQVADKINSQDPVQKYAECHSWDMSNSNATKYHEIKVGILDNTCFKENVPTFEILVGWILRLGLNLFTQSYLLFIGFKKMFRKLLKILNQFFFFFFSFSTLAHKVNEVWKWHKIEKFDLWPQFTSCANEGLSNLHLLLSS